MSISSGHLLPLPPTDTTLPPPATANMVSSVGEQRTHTDLRPVSPGPLSATTGVPNRTVTNKGAVLETEVIMEEDERKFGFSIAGGGNRNQFPRIDAITAGTAGDRADLEIGDEVIEVNGLSLANATHEEIITTIHKSSHTRAVLLTIVREAKPTDIQRTDSKVARRVQSYESGSVIASDADEDSSEEDGRGENVAVAQQASERASESSSEEETETAAPVPAPRIPVASESSDEELPNQNSSREGQAIVQNGNLRSWESTDHVNNGRETEEEEEEDQEEEILMKRQSNDELQSAHLFDDLFDDDSELDVDTLKRSLNEQERDEEGDDIIAAVDDATLRRSLEHYQALEQCADQNDYESIPTLETVQRTLERKPRRQIQSEEMQALSMAHERLERERRGDTSPFPESMQDHVDLRYVTLFKSTQPLGATVKRSGSAVVIARVVKGGLVESAGSINVGDELVEINGQRVRGRSIDDVSNLMSSLAGDVTLVVKPGPDARADHFTHADFHLRALFDFDAEKDQSVPCRELGLSFKVRDILHVNNVDDESWWQAYKEGDNSKLAGLIPSKKYLQQKDDARRIQSSDSIYVNNKKGFLCTKKKKKSVANKIQTNDTRRPVISYEEVALLSPVPGLSRPLVLVSPLERDKTTLIAHLIKKNPTASKCTQPVMHTTRAQREGEVHGEEFFFVRETEFRELERASRFVSVETRESGMFGLSIDAVQTTISSGFQPLFSCPASAIMKVRNASLKPYIVFLACPPAETLKRHSAINRYNFTEEDVERLLVGSWEMHDRYGYLFDQVIQVTELPAVLDKLMDTLRTLESRPLYCPKSWSNTSDSNYGPGL